MIQISFETCCLTETQFWWCKHIDPHTVSHMILSKNYRNKISAMNLEKLHNLRHVIWSKRP